MRSRFSRGNRLPSLSVREKSHRRVPKQQVLVDFLLERRHLPIGAEELPLPDGQRLFSVHRVDQRALVLCALVPLCCVSTQIQSAVIVLESGLYGIDHRAVLIEILKRVPNRVEFG